jgi:hypothetical protein
VLIELAIECDDGGWIYVAPEVPFTLKQLAKEIGLRRVSTCLALLNALVTLRLVTINDSGILINSFSERNYESDVSTPRVRKYREKQKNKVDDSAEVKRFRNVTETDQNRTETEQNRTEHKKPPISPKGGNGYDSDFLSWWEEYPARRKSGKPKVYKKWLQLKKAGELPPLPEMIRTLEKQKVSTDWIKNAGEFIPGPFPYLNQSRYIDESKPMTPGTICTQPGIASWLAREEAKHET